MIIQWKSLCIYELNASGKRKISFYEGARLCLTNRLRVFLGYFLSFPSLLFSLVAEEAAVEEASTLEMAAAVEMMAAEMVEESHFRAMPTWLH